MIRKLIILAGFIVFVVIQTHAQEFSYPVSSSSEDPEIRIRVGHTELMVTGTSENRITIHSSGGYETTDSRAEGLLPVTPWPENTGLGLHLGEENGVISIIKSDRKTNAQYEISVPERANINIEETEWGNGSFHLQELEGDIYLKSNSSDISMNNVSGSVRASTTSGNMIIQMPPAGIDKNHKISSVSGKIDLQIQKGASYSFDLSTISGTIFTDFELIEEIKYKSSTLRRIGRVKNIKTDLNGGGDHIKASTVSGVLNILFIE